ncbi:MAG: hypothetical protein AAFN77_05555 [Planctomycetota bacterium]
MKRTIRMAMPLLAVACLMLVGCSNGYTVVPVSGTVTINGEPAAGVKIVYYPKGTEANPAPGPYSSATSGADGKYSLVTRDGETGAIVGDHRVAIEMNDGGEGVTQEMLDEAKGEMEENQSDGDKESFDKARKRYLRMKKQMEKVAKIPKEYMDGKTISVTVGKSGTDTADIDL